MLFMITALSTVLAFAASPDWAEKLEDSCRRVLANHVHLRSRYLPWEMRAPVLGSFSHATLLLRLPQGDQTSAFTVDGIRVLEGFRVHYERSENIVMHGTVEGFLNLSLPAGSQYAVLSAIFRDTSVLLRNEQSTLSVELGDSTSDETLSSYLRMHHALMISDQKTDQRYHVYPRSGLSNSYQDSLGNFGIARHELRDKKLLPQLRELGSLINERTWFLPYRRWVVITEKALRILLEHRSKSNPAHVFAIDDPRLTQVLIETLRLESDRAFHVDGSFDRRVLLID